MSRRTWTAVHSAINRSLKLAELRDHAARLFFHQLIQAVDSHGCIDARPHVLLVEVWPLLGETVASTEAAARELERVGLVVRKRDAKAEWLEIPDWNEKAGALIRKRGKRAFGAEPVRDGAGLVRALKREKAEFDPEGPESEPETGSSRDKSRTASNSNSPSRSSLAVEPSSSPRVSRTHAREQAPPADPEPAATLSEVARVHLVRHAALCTAAVSAALVRWEAWARSRGQTPKWTSERWAAGFTEWATWGPDRLVRAIDRSITVGSNTVLEPFGDRASTSSAKPDAASSANRASREAHERRVESLWFDHEPRVETEEVSQVTGLVVKRSGPARKYPGHEAAEAELTKRGLLLGAPDVRKSA